MFIDRVTKVFQIIILFSLPDFLAKARNDQIAGKSTPGTRPALLRALFSAGLLCQHFDFDKQIEDDKKVKTKFSS